MTAVAFDISLHGRASSMSTCATVTETAGAVIPVSVATLLPQTVPGVSLYVEMDYGEQKSLRLYRAREYSVTAEDLAALRDRGIATLYVSGDEYRQYQEYLRQNLDLVLADDSVASRKRVGCLNEVVRDVLGDIFRRGDLDKRMEEVKELGEKTVRAICRDDVVLTELRGVLYHDYHTFTHSANVSVY